MKKLNLFLSVLTLLIISSCSSDKNDEPQLSMEELLVQGSPWTFDRYEVVAILDSGNSNLTKQQIETQINQQASGDAISFSQNKSGISTINGSVESTWSWEIINQNQLKITFDGNTNQTITYDNLNVTANELVIQSDGASYDQDAKYEVLHNGKYYYN